MKYSFVSQASWFAAIALAAAFAFAGPSAVAQSESSKTQTLTGTVSDTHCGAKHAMTNVSAAECTRMCVKTGSKYALVVGDKVYTLTGHERDLDKYAGQTVTLQGAVTGENVKVTSVSPAS